MDAVRREQLEEHRGPLHRSTVERRSSLPRANQFEVTTANVALTTGGPFLGLTPECDDEFSTGGCAASTGQSSTEAPLLEGPSSSTDSSLEFTETVMWTAVPST